jgi:hypothetical protein
MKNTILCLAALLITFLMTSCNKDRLDETIVDDGSKAVLKLRASCNVDNRSDIEHDEQDSSILNVTWNCSDKVYVFGAKEGFLGTLLLDDDCEGKEIGQFTGTIDRFETQVLHFFYLGKASRDFNKTKRNFRLIFPIRMVCWMELRKACMLLMEVPKRLFILRMCFRWQLFFKMRWRSDIST